MKMSKRTKIKIVSVVILLAVLNKPYKDTNNNQALSDVVRI